MSRFSDGSIRRDIPGLPGDMIVLGNTLLKKNKGTPDLYTITNATSLTKGEIHVFKLDNPGITKIVEFHGSNGRARYAIECRYDIDNEDIIASRYTNPHSKLYSAFSGKFVDSAKQHKSDELGHFKYLNVELYTISVFEGVGDVLMEDRYIRIDGVSDPGVFEDKGAMGVVVNVDKLIHALRNKGMISKPEVKRKREEEHAPVPAFYEDELDSLIHKGDSAERIYSEEIKLALELQAKFDALKHFKSVLYDNGNPGDNRHIIQIVSTYFQHKTILDAELNSMLVPKIKDMQDILEGRQPQHRINTLLKEIDSIFLPSFERLLSEIKRLSMYHPKLKKNFNVDINDLTAPEHALNMLHQHSTSAKFDTTEKLAELRRKQLVLDGLDLEGGSRLKQKPKTRKRTKKRNKKRNKSKRHKGYSRR